MIKVRVDWHSRCPGCGTELEFDFLGGVSDSVVCPWCGHLCETNPGSDCEELKRFLYGAIRDLEQEVNQKIVPV